MQPSSNTVADTICRTAELGLAITNAAHNDAVTVIECEALAPINAALRVDSLVCCATTPAGSWWIFLLSDFPPGCGCVCCAFGV